MTSPQTRSPPLPLTAYSHPHPLPPLLDSLHGKMGSTETDRMDMDGSMLLAAPSSPAPSPPSSPASQATSPCDGRKHMGLSPCSIPPSIRDTPSIPDSAHYSHCAVSPLIPTHTAKRASHKRRHGQDDVVLDVPQLVAILHLRFWDRATTRPRSRSMKIDSERSHHSRISPSPLSRVAFVAD